MPFSDFEGKDRWKITTSTAVCAKDEIVSVAGPEASVTVTCTGGHTYPTGTYDSGKNEIADAGNVYKLRRSGADLDCNPAPASITPGSWTAEDQGPGEEGGV